MSSVKYNVIAKVGNPGDNPSAPSGFIRLHNVVDLLDLTANYLDRDWPDWRYFNVFDANTRLPVASFTKNRRPTQKTC